MNLYLIISGNLTGFSHFYASAGAKDFYEQSKIDFDFRNYLLFLKERQKAYAVSFTDKTIAVSLVTRVLDSFRRPGVLNMTLLLPRKYKVSDKGGLQGGAALYQLLNEVNDMFYQRNFLNGMMNQNGAVLMQDYYSPILEKYQLVPDPKQRDVNARINVALAKNNVGYIAAAESDIPLYLETLCRESYEGYHHVFLASDAPQNINESPVEEVFYPVRYTSNMEAGVEYSLPKKVRMSDKIDLLPNLRGYVAFNQDYTYEQIFQGACKQITAQLRNEVIYLTYLFEEEHRKVTFEFQFGTSKIDMREIFPVKLWIGNQENYLQNNSLVFSGKEIYQPIRLVCENGKYEFVPGTANIDLSRYPEKELTVYVQVQSKTVENPEQTILRLTLPLDGVFTIRIINKPTGRVESFNQVKGNWQKMVSGDISDWRYEIVSDKYEVLSGNFPQPSILNFLKKQGTQNQSNSQLSSQTKYPVQIKDSERKTGAVSDGGGKKQPERNKFIRANLVVFSFLSVAVLALLGLGGYIVYDKLIGRNEGGQEDSENVDDNACKIRLSPIISSDTLRRKDLEDLGLKCELICKDSIFDIEKKYEDSLIYTLKPRKGISDSIYNNSTVTLAVIYDEEDTIFKYSEKYSKLHDSYSNKPMLCTLDIFYNLFSLLKSSDINSLDTILNESKESKLQRSESIIKKMKWGDTNLYKTLSGKLDELKQQAESIKNNETKRINAIKTDLEKVDVTLTQIEGFLNEIKKFKYVKAPEVQNKAGNLKNVIKNLQNGILPDQTQNSEEWKLLSSKQRKILEPCYLNGQRIKSIQLNKNNLNLEKIQSINDFIEKVKGSGIIKK